MTARSLQLAHCRWLRPLWAAALLVVLALGGWLLGSQPAPAASAAITVTATIPSSVSITNTCTSNAAWNLGTVLPGATSLTTTGANVCRLGFQSSNDTSMLRIGQADPNGTAAMSSGPDSMTDQEYVNNFNAIAAGSATTVYASGRLSIAYKTIDGGSTWNTMTGPGISTVYSMTTFGVNTVVAVGNDDQTIRRSTDGGNTWSTAVSPWFDSMNDMDSANATVGYAVGNGGMIFYTSNGGANWATGSCGGCPDQFLSVSAVAGTNTAYAVGDELWKTVDGGATWTRVVNFPSWGLSIDAFDANHLFVGQCNGNMYASTDGGTTWNTATVTGDMQDYQECGGDVYATSASTAVAVGGRGNIWRTTNNGVSWTQIPSPSSTGNRQLAGWGTKVWAAQSSASIIGSPDGITWSSQLRLGNDLYGVSAAPDNVAWTVGGFGTIRKTTDGTTWNAQASGTTQHLWSVSAANSSTAWAVGSAGTILYTTNGGTNWSSQSSPTGQRLLGVSASGPYRAWAVGDAGTIVGTSNGGTTWSTQTSPTGNDLTAVAAADTQTAWAVGDGGVIIKTSDGGATWATQVSGTTEVLHAVWATSPTTAWAAGNNSTFLSTTNGGTTWTPVPVPGMSAWTPIFGVSMTDPQNGMLLGGCDPRRIVNGAVNPNTIGNYWCIDYWSAAALDANSAYIVGENQMIARADTGTPISDYGAAPNNWAGSAAANMFGMCVQAIGGSAAIVGPYVVDTTNSPGNCQATDADPWAAVPTSMTKIANTASAGQAGTVDFVWGVRMSSNQAKGSYRATVVFEALAPAV